MSLFRRTTGVKLTPKAPSTKMPTQYAYEWFANHPNEKPTINLTIISDDLTLVRKMLRGSILNNDIKIDVAKTFLYLYLKTVKSTLTGEWKSYGVSIAQDGDEITPLTLVSVQAKLERKEFTGIEATEDDDAWMAIYVAAIYRLIRAKVSNYKIQIAKQITKQIKSANPSGSDISEVVGFYAGWMNDKGYNGLIACIDMFFNRFPDHRLSNIRISTIGSRYRDCSGLLSYWHIMNVLGMSNANDFVEWVFINKVKDDIVRMMKDEDELTDDFSYFPYQVDLGLVMKSSHSASANSYFFELAHLTGALLRSERSMKARHICEEQSMKLLLNAGCISYVFSHNFEINKVYSKNPCMPNVSESDSDDKDIIPSTSDNVNATMISRNPSDGIKMLKATDDSQIPDEVRSYIIENARKIKNPRKGTVDAHFASIASTL